MTKYAWYTVGRCTMILQVCPAVNMHRTLQPGCSTSCAKSSTNACSCAGEGGAREGSGHACTAAAFTCCMQARKLTASKQPCKKKTATHAVHDRRVPCDRGATGPQLQGCGHHAAHNACAEPPTCSASSCFKWPASILSPAQSWSGSPTARSACHLSCRSSECMWLRAGQRRLFA